MTLSAPLIDAHAHTWSREFERDYDATIDRAWDAGLTAVVEVGTDSETSLRAALRTLFEGGEFVGIGEIGLDFYRNLSPPEVQYEALLWQLDLARELSLPVVIHSRDADEDCFAVLAEWSRKSGRYLGAEREIGMMHCYAGDAELAQRYQDIGFLISVPGTVTYANNQRGREVARSIPLGAMLVETDCPYLTPQPHRGSRNEPSYVLRTAQEVADLRGCSLDEVATATANNAARLFGFTI